MPDYPVLSYYMLTMLILGIGYGIKSLELISISRTYLSHAPNNWEIVGVDEMQQGRLSGVFKKLYSRTGMTALCLITIAALLIALLFWSRPVVLNIAITFVFLCQLFIYHRQDFGGDGADQMSFIVLLTVVLCFVLNGSDPVRRLGLFFIAGQLLLSYSVSGIAKLISREWRSGLAIRGVLATYTYGTPFTRRLFSRNHLLSRIVAWCVMLLEALFPLALLGNETVFLVVFAAGLCMHLTIGFVMGLNDFIWSFSAAYPALYFLYQQTGAS